MLAQLKKIGLSDGDARTYLAALELGEGNIKRIAQKARIKRTTLYGHIASLREQGLLKRTKIGKKNIYYAEDPHALLGHVEERESIVKSVLPSLIALSGVGDKKPKVLYFEGNEGMKNVYKETLAFPSTAIYSWISESAFKTEGKWFDDYYRPQRKKKRIYTQAIVPNTEMTREYHAQDADGFHKTRIESSDKLVVESDILLFGGRYVALLSWEEMIGMVIESKKIHDTLQSIFEIHWNALAK